MVGKLIERKCPRCEEYFPATPQFFEKRKSSLGIGGFCRSCLRQDQAERDRRHYDKVHKGKRQTRWGALKPKWITVEKRVIDEWKSICIGVAKTRGVEYLTDDLIQEVLILVHQGKRPKVTFVVGTLIQRDLGMSGSARRRMTLNTVELDPNKIAADTTESEQEGETGNDYET